MDSYKPEAGEKEIKEEDVVRYILNRQQRYGEVQQLIEETFAEKKATEARNYAHNRKEIGQEFKTEI